MIGKSDWIANKYHEVKSQPKKLLICITIVFVAVLGLITLYLIFYLVFIYPMDQVSELEISNVSQKADLINKYRTNSIQFISTLAQIFGGIAVGIGIYFAWGNLVTSREGQITERFTRAIDQLGSQQIEIKLGGIYALERIANESNKDYWSIMEILTAYIRKNSSVDIQPKENYLEIENKATDIQVNETKKNDCLNAITVPLDIQAILTVIVRRRYSFGNGEKNNLNLKRTNLRNLDFYKAKLSRANFFGADLSAAQLSEAELFKAKLTDAKLERAMLIGATLSFAKLRNAKLCKAFLWGADLFYADLSGANLYEAKLYDADLRGADLSEADLRNAKLLSANLRNAKLQGADLSDTDLSDADLSGADLSGANLYRADLTEAKKLSLNQLSKVKTLYKAKLDEELLIPLKEKYPALFEEPEYWSWV